MKDRSNTLLSVCMMRASLGKAETEGIDVATAPTPTKLKALRLVGSGMPKAMRVATFVVLWALALHDLNEDDLTLTEWRRWAKESERTAWRWLAEFRELFPEFETPTPLALQIRRELRRGKGVSTVTAMNLPVAV